MTTVSDHPPPKTKARKGFAAMHPDKVKEIASKGGKAAHVAGTAHKFSHEEAVAAGRKGGAKSRRRKKVVEAQDSVPPIPYVGPV